MHDVKKTINSSDGKRRLHIWRREDGLFQYEEEYLWDDEDQGQRYSTWRTQYPPSGMFPDENAAKEDARHAFAWLAEAK